MFSLTTKYKSNIIKVDVLSYTYHPFFGLEIKEGMATIEEEITKWFLFKEKKIKFRKFFKSKYNINYIWLDTMKEAVCEDWVKLNNFVTVFEANLVGIK